MTQVFSNSTDHFVHRKRKSEAKVTTQNTDEYSYRRLSESVKVLRGWSADIIKLQIFQLQQSHKDFDKFKQQWCHCVLLIVFLQICVDILNPIGLFTYLEKLPSPCFRQFVVSASILLIVQDSEKLKSRFRFFRCYSFNSITRILLIIPFILLPSFRSIGAVKMEPWFKSFNVFTKLLTSSHAIHSLFHFPFPVNRPAMISIFMIPSYRLLVHHRHEMLLGSEPNLSVGTPVRANLKQSFLSVCLCSFRSSAFVYVPMSDRPLLLPALLDLILYLFPVISSLFFQQFLFWIHFVSSPTFHKMFCSLANSFSPKSVFIFHSVSNFLLCSTAGGTNSPTAIGRKIKDFIPSFTAFFRFKWSWSKLFHEED